MGGNQSGPPEDFGATVVSATLRFLFLPRPPISVLRNSKGAVYSIITFGAASAPDWNDSNLYNFCRQRRPASLLGPKNVIQIKVEDALHHGTSWDPESKRDETMTTMVIYLRRLAGPRIKFSSLGTVSLCRTACWRFSLRIFLLFLLLFSPPPTSLLPPSFSVSPSPLATPSS